MPTWVVDSPSASVLVAELGLARGVTGYIHHMVPICLHTWLRAPRDFAGAVEGVIALGGDTDTTAAIVGALDRR